MLKDHRLELTKRLFEEALALHPARRTEWLQRRLGTDAALRIEIEDLLRHSTGRLPAPAVKRDLAPRPEPTSLEPGDLFAGRYRVGTCLGEGRTCTVYLVNDTLRARTLALKILRPDSGLDVEHLLRERRVLGRIRHPNVCRLFDVFEHRGMVCLTMEFVEGGSLAALLAQTGRLEPRRVHQLGLALAEGLAVAHELGIVHRDLKPANILLAASGKAKIADFGLAATAGAEMDGLVVGTPLYMAPEQLAAEGVVSAACDVYALATVLYEAATERLPFSGSDVIELEERKRENRPVPPSRLCPGLHPDLESAVLAALSPVPKERPATGRAFAKLLSLGLDSASRGAEPRRGEKRLLTVLSVGFTPFSTGGASPIEPVDRALRLASGIVSEHGGHVAAVTHDALLAYFGFPAALEDHADRAIRAARDLVTRGQEAADRSGMSLRVGLYSGVTRLGYVTASSQLVAFGESPRAAERLREAAQPGEALVSSETARRARVSVGTAKEERIRLDDQADAIPVYRLRASNAHRAMRASLHHGRFVGRSAEIESLAALLKLTRSGHQLSVLVSGEAGIGKTRLIDEFRNRHDDGAVRWLEICPAEQYKSSAFWCVRSLLEKELDLNRCGSDCEKRAWIISALERAGIEPEHHLDNVLVTLGLPTSEPEVDQALGVRPPRHQSILALARSLATPVSGKTTIVVCEDLQWCDPSTLAILASLMEDKQRPLMMLASARPGFVVPWPVVRDLRLVRLDPAESRLLVEELTQGQKPSEPQLREILRRGDGIPLFLEALAEDFVHGWTGGLVPTSLRGLLEALLDQLGEAKHAAQLAACLGSRFSEADLAVATVLGIGDLREKIDRMLEAGVLRRVPDHTEHCYEFEHALLGEVAHETLPVDQRRESHAAIAWAIAAGEPERVARNPEIVALHVEEAGVLPAALDGWERAAIAALSRSENIEAKRHVERALALVSRAAAADRQNDTELRLRLRLAQALSQIDYGSLDLETNLELIRQLIPDEKNPAHVASLVQLAWLRLSRGDGNALYELISREEQILREGVAPGLALALHSHLACCYVDGGDLVRGRRHFDQAMAIWPLDAAEIPTDPVTQWAWLSLGTGAGWLFWHEGRLSAARTLIDSLLPRLIEQLPVLAAGCEAFYASVLLMLGDIEGSRRWAEHSWTTLGRLGNQPFASLAHGIFGASLAAAGETEAGVAELRAATARMHDISFALMRPLVESFLAEALLRLDRLDEAERALSSALHTASRGADRVWEPDLHRIRGKLMTRSGRPDEAEACLRQALGLARAGENRSLELRAATDLARLMRDRGRCEEARALLAPVFAAFRGEYQTPDVRAARAALDEANGLPEPAPGRSHRRPAPSQET